MAIELLSEPPSGTITLGSVDSTDARGEAQIRELRPHVQIVHQKPVLLPHPADARRWHCD